MEHYLMDIIFPLRACNLCREKGRYHSRKPWCNNCHEEIRQVHKSKPICGKCGKYLQDNGKEYCSDCNAQLPAFKIARAVGPYENDKIRKAVKVLKFLGRKYMHIAMGTCMAQVVLNEPEFWPIDAIVPVPISRYSLKNRGFNQSELLAKQIGHIIKVKGYAHLLHRVKETPPQRELSREERQFNLRYAFEICEISRVKGKHILLVDDVYTTGSTAMECTNTLLNAGAEDVSVIVWATGTSF